MTPHHYDNPQTAAFRATLDLLPDEIALAIGLHVYDDSTLLNGYTCVCGWAVREALARVINVAPTSSEAKEFLMDRSIAAECSKRFGGNLSDWWYLYMGVTNQNAPLIEEALFDRVMAAAEASE